MSLTGDVSGAIDYALSLLRRELPDSLTYHNYGHTANEVLPAVDRMIAESDLTEEQREILRVAASFHDSGFTVGYDEHELRGVDLVHKTLPQFGFSPNHIDRVSELIMATRLPQTPVNRSAEILADADLDVLGHPDFFKRNLALRTELGVYRTLIDVEKWYRGQLNFLRQHAYFTSMAAAFRREQKLEHISRLSEWLVYADPESQELVMLGF